MPVNTKIQLRRGTASSWTSTNPILSAGEVGYETDTGLFKVGDGTTAWNSIDYAALPFNGVDDKPYFGSGVFQSLAQGSGINLSYNASLGKTTINLSDPTIQVADITDFVDGVNDRVANLLTQGSGIQLTYTDTNNSSSSLRVAVTGVSFSGHTHTLSNIIDVTASATEVNYLYGSVPGTGVASKAVVLDANKNITGIGQITTTGNLIVGNDLIVNGNTVTVNSTTVTIDDPIFTLGGDTAPVSDDGKDRGIDFRWHNGSVAKLGFFGFDDSTGKFTFIPDATNTGEIFGGTKGEVDANVDWANILNKPDPIITGILTGDVTGTGTVTLTDLGNGTLTIDATIGPNSVALGTDTTGNYVASIANGNFLTGGGAGSEGAALTLGVNAATSGVSNVVARDSSGNFSAGTITATFSGNGASITGINADNISTGTLNAARLPSVSQTNTATGPTASFVSSVSVDTYGRVTGVNTTTHTLATTTVKGIASFDTNDFTVAAGAVSIKASGIGNSQLENDSVTIGQTELVLGSTYSAISGISAANPVVLTYFAIDGGTP